MSEIKSYISNLSYNYAETYSGFRGPLFGKFLGKLKSQIAKLEKEVENTRFMESQKMSKEIASLKSKMYSINSRLINLDGQKHESTELICRLNGSDLKLMQLCNTLSMKFVSDSAWMCAPIYRDSIAFYKEDDIVGIIHLCFSCESIQDGNENTFLAESKIFPNLKNQLIELGHKIVDDEPFENIKNSL